MIPDILQFGNHKRDSERFNETGFGIKCSGEAVRNHTMRNTIIKSEFSLLFFFAPIAL
jgi:hypothetical protein